MEHPEKATGGWILDNIVFEDGSAGIAVGLLRNDARLMLALRWLPSPEYLRKDGKVEMATSWMDGETGWFLLPFDFAVAVGKSLIEKKVAGLAGFDDAGFSAMVRWLVEFDAVSDAICY